MTETEKGKSTTTTPGSIPWAHRRVRGERREGLGKSREKKKDSCGLKFGEKEKAGEGKNWGKRGM